MTSLDLSRLQNITLRYGSHDSVERGLCAMEAVAWLAGEEHTDQPACACVIVGAFVRPFNDSLPSDEHRTRLLLPLVPKLVGSRSSVHVDVDLDRSYLAADWAVRVVLPLMLRRVDGAFYGKHVARLCDLPKIVDHGTAQSAVSAVSAVARATVTHTNLSRMLVCAANAADYAGGGFARAAAHATANAVDYAASVLAAIEAYGDYEALWTEGATLIERMLDIRE